MKKIVYAVLATLSGLVLLFSYKTSLGASIPIAAAASGARVGVAGASGAGGATGSAGTSRGSGSGAAAGSGTNTAPSASALKDGTFTGATAQTRYGGVQVVVTVAGGKITQVQVPQYPSDNGRDQELSSYALPQLVNETIAAQSAQIDMISGATYTSTGYQQSLQSALDQAKR